MDADLVDLVHRARAGDDAAWEELVDRFRGLIGAVTRSFRLAPSDAADVAQTTWLRLLESIERVREPARLAGWIATTTRRECLRVLRTSGRELPSDEVDRGEPSHSYAAPGEELIGTELRATVCEAVHALPDRHRRLMQVLMTEPSPAYATVAGALAMPVGSIGPTRGRAIEQLRRDPRILALAS
ncbi:sigma-70 family RNA polymerase sigma factor [soil metagenome]